MLRVSILYFIFLLITGSVLIPCKSLNVTHSPTSYDEIVSTFRSVDQSKLSSKEQSFVDLCARGDSEALYNVSLLLIQQKIELFGHENIPIAVKVLDYLAELGSLKAQLTLSEIFLALESQLSKCFITHSLQVIRDIIPHFIMLATS